MIHLTSTSATPETGSTVGSIYHYGHGTVPTHQEGSVPSYHYQGLFCVTGNLGSSLNPPHTHPDTQHKTQGPWHPRILTLPLLLQQVLQQEAVRIECPSPSPILTPDTLHPSRGHSILQFSTCPNPPHHSQGGPRKCSSDHGVHSTDDHMMVCQLDQALGPRYVIKFTPDVCVRLAWVRVFWKSADFEQSALSSVMWMDLIQPVDGPSRTKYAGIPGQERMLQQELPNLNMPWSPAWEPTLQISDSHVSLRLSINNSPYVYMDAYLTGSLSIESPI